MLLLQFINRHRSQYDQIALFNDLSQDQRKEALKKTLQDWSNAWPRANCYGTCYTITGQRLGVLPLNYLYATYSQLVASNVINLQTFYAYFGAVSTNPFTTLGSSSVSPFYGQSYLTNLGYSEVPTTTTDRGRIAIDLGSNATATAQKAISYSGLHEIADQGKLLTISSLPNNNDPLTVGNKSYILKTVASAANDIQIAPDIYQMAEVLSDRFYVDRASTLVESTPDFNTVQLRPYNLGESITLTVDGTRLISSTLPALNTVPHGDQWKVFELLLSNIAQMKEIQSINQESYDQAKAFNLLKKDHLSRVKPYMLEAR